MGDLQQNGAEWAAFVQSLVVNCVEGCRSLLGALVFSVCTAQAPALNAAGWLVCMSWLQWSFLSVIEPCVHVARSDHRQLHVATAPEARQTDSAQHGAGALILALRISASHKRLRHHSRHAHVHLRARSGTRPGPRTEPACRHEHAMPACAPCRQSGCTICKRGSRCRTTVMTPRTRWVGCTPVFLIHVGRSRLFASGPGKRMTTAVLLGTWFVRTACLECMHGGSSAKPCHHGGCMAMTSTCLPHPSRSNSLLLRARMR